jgi:hypothetical protein
VPTLSPFTVDLTAHEGVRLAAVLAALGTHWDPADVYAGEIAAHRMLYSGLDPDQHASYQMLLANGVLPHDPGW